MTVGVKELQKKEKLKKVSGGHYDTGTERKTKRRHYYHTGSIGAMGLGCGFVPGP